MSYHAEKLKHLAHYVIAKCGSKAGFGATKLNKILWFADARQYMLTGKSITGAVYTKQEFGPVPKAIMPVRSALIREGKIREFPPKQKFQGHGFKSLANPDLTLFTAAEIANVDYWLKEICDNHTADSISELSHDYGWEIADMGSALPFSAFMAERIRKPNDEEMSWVRAEVQRLGLN